MKYQFIGFDERIYQFFSAKHGDVREFEVPPADGLWIAVPEKKNPPKKDAA